MRLLFSLGLVLVSTAVMAADTVVLVAGGGNGADGTEATKAKLIQPFAVDFDKAGNIFFVEMAGGERLRKIDAKGILTTLAGTGKKGGSADKIAGDKAEFNGMHNLICADDFIFLADTFNHRLRMYKPSQNEVRTLAGTGTEGYAGDGGPPTKVDFKQPICIAMSPDQTRMYIADIGNKRIRYLDPKKGAILTFAGTGKAGIPKDGELAKDQPLVDPRAVAADKNGNVYILERNGHALRVVDKDGKIRTVAGTGKAGSGGDGGPALKAAMNGPKSISIDPADDSVLIADTENHQILRYVPKSETMELIAGTGKKGSGGLDGDPLKLEMGRPHGVCVHPKTGEIYIADSDNNRIVKIVKWK